MLNRYPLWKYVMPIMVIVIGLLHVLPSLFGEDPAVQIIDAREIAAGG